MSLVSIGSTLRFASIKLINQNECKLAMSLMKARQMSVASALCNNNNYHGNYINNGALLAINRCKSRNMATSPGIIGAMVSSKRYLSTHEITKNLLLISSDKMNAETDAKTLRLKQQRDKPLVLMLSWLQAKHKHLKKYAELYTEQGFDVLIAQITPWQLLWPTKGAQPVATDIVKFLYNNQSYAPMVIHGFSVGGYLWGECMAQMALDLDKYKPMLARIVAQIWDSAADITEIPEGVPRALFPKNVTLQNALRSYMLYHLKTFHDTATVHYIRSSQMFHYSLVTAPALFLVSKTDPVGAESSNQRVRECLESKNIQCTWKCWDRSPHVGHFMKHRDEYIESVFAHLNSVNLLKNDKNVEKLRAKL
ncbi:transmembrane protein 53-A [Culicoides brevitarsis]|uniref:transmembrane protein 53-A n=1 Tax=Culicoides brevitarsis TaxID=469753 RepID=UPI00307B2941